MTQIWVLIQTETIISILWSFRKTEPIHNIPNLLWQFNILNINIFNQSDKYFHLTQCHFEWKHLFFDLLSFATLNIASAWLRTHNLSQMIWVSQLDRNFLGKPKKKDWGKFMSHQLNCLQQEDLCWSKVKRANCPTESQWGYCHRF